MKRLGMALVLAACGGGSDADVAGTYAMQVTNGDNGCMFANWTVGAQGEAPVTITQEGPNVTATVMGVAAISLGIAVGSNVFTGTIDGDDLDLAIIGDNALSMGSCAYTINAELHATVNGDSMSGRLEYRAATNNSSECGALTGCLTVQQFAGSRPPPP